MKEVSGFKFVFDQNACEKCGGKCCIGQSGAVWVSEEEISRISEFLGVTQEAFKSRHTRRLGAKTSLVEYPFEGGFACEFFERKTRRCGIYEVRPQQCRTFPFWQAFREDFSELLSECEGVKVKDENE